MQQQGAWGCSPGILSAVSFAIVNFCVISCPFSVFPLESKKRMVYNTVVYAFFAKNHQDQ